MILKLSDNFYIDPTVIGSINRQIDDECGCGECYLTILRFKNGDMRYFDSEESDEVWEHWKASGTALTADVIAETAFMRAQEKGRRRTSEDLKTAGELGGKVTTIN